MFGAEYDGSDGLYTYYYKQGKKITGASTFKGRQIWDLNKNIWTIGSSKSEFDEITYQAEVSNYNFYIFANSGYTGEFSGATIFKLYSFKIFDNDVLIRDYLPAKRISDGVAGLYDVANDVFYTNANTSGDAFTEGAAV